MSSNVPSAPDLRGLAVLHVKRSCKESRHPLSSRSTTPSPRDHADNEIERNDQVYEAAPVSTSGLSAFVRNIERSFQHAPRVRVRIAKVSGVHRQSLLFQ